MATNSEMESAFDSALESVERAIAGDMRTLAGDSARLQLEKLLEELRAERAIAVKRGSVERDWFQRTVRWVVEWAPETDPTLLAALGRIAQATPPR